MYNHIMYVQVGLESLLTMPQPLKSGIVPPVIYNSNSPYGLTADIMIGIEGRKGIHIYVYICIYIHIHIH
jgi:hypothetical protein